jgi:p-hydroxybenzoate 3-monooxygenase
MTSMLHNAPGASDFDEQRQFAELGSVVASVRGSAFLAEGYTGWPSANRAR